MLIAGAFWLRARVRAGAWIPEGRALPVPAGIEVIRNVEIGNGGGRRLHVEIVRPKLPGPTPMPAVLWIHGGGWQEGSHKADGAWRHAIRGYFTASIEYRLSGEAQWPAQIEDCKLAVRWLRANAAQYHVDPERIGVMGISAGGHLAAFLGLDDAPAANETAAGFAGVSSRVQCVVDFSGPTDFTQGSAGLLGKFPPDDAPILVKLFGRTFRERPEIWKQASPIAHVHTGVPPFLIIQGEKDTLVPMAHAERLGEALRRIAQPVELIRVKNADHVFRAVSAKQPMEPDANQLAGQVDTFLDRYLKR